MLVLKQRVGDKVHLFVGDTKITVQVVDFDKRTVEVGFKAPPDVEILRDGVKRNPEKQRKRIAKLRART